MQGIRHLLLLSGALLLFSGCGMLNVLGIGWNENDAPNIADAPSVGHISPAGRAAREIVVFYSDAEPYLGHPSSEGVIRTYGPHISTVVGFWHQIDRNAPDRLVEFGTTTPEGIERAVALARSVGARPAGLFHNLLYGRTQVSKDVVANLLQSEEHQDGLVRSIGANALAYGFAEVNVDLENVDAHWRDALSTFVERLAAHLDQLGIDLSLSVPAKTWDDPRNGWSGAFDYRRLGAAADRVYLMTYDEHGFVSGPGPIASSGWVERAVRYAVSEIPSRKVFVGLAGYGFDWPASGKPRYISHDQAVAKANAVGAPIVWDDRSNSPTYSYQQGGTTRHVWFENAASASWKLNLVTKYDLGGIALWRGGLEDPDLWRVIGQKFAATKAS